MMRPNTKTLNKYMKAVELEAPKENCDNIFFVIFSTLWDR